MISSLKKTDDDGSYIFLWELDDTVVEFKNNRNYIELNVRHLDYIDDIYKELVLDFNSKLSGLSLQERKDLILALKVYGTAISLSLNKLDSIPNYDKMSNDKLWSILMKDDDFKDIVPSQIEYLKKGAGLVDIEKEVLRIINVSSSDNFIASLKKVLAIIDKYKEYFVLPRDLLVFRGIAAKKGGKNSISQGDIVSTSLDYNTADLPTNRPEYGFVNWIDVMLIEAGTPYMLGTAPLSKKQKEIIFFKSKFFGKETKFWPAVPNIDGKSDGIRRNVKIFILSGKLLDKNCKKSI